MPYASHLPLHVIGACAISFVLAAVTFIQANARIGLLFNPNTVVHPQLGRCLWYSLAALVACTGAFIFLIAALPPPSHRPPPPEDLMTREKYNGTDYRTRHQSERLYGREARPGSINGSEVYRSHSRRSAMSSTAGGGDRRSYKDYPDNGASKKSYRSHRSNRSRRDDYSDGEPEVEEIERPRRSRRKAPRNADDYEDEATGVSLSTYPYFTLLIMHSAGIL